LQALFKDAKSGKYGTGVFSSHCIFTMLQAYSRFDPPWASQAVALLKQANAGAFGPNMVTHHAVNLVLLALARSRVRVSEPFDPLDASIALIEDIVAAKYGPNLTLDLNAVNMVLMGYARAEPPREDAGRWLFQRAVAGQWPGVVPDTYTHNAMLTLLKNGSARLEDLQQHLHCYLPPHGVKPDAYTLLTMMAFASHLRQPELAQQWVPVLVAAGAPVDAPVCDMIDSMFHPDVATKLKRELLELLRARGASIGSEPSRARSSKRGAPGQGRT
jgi:hypothetical protein